MNFKKIISLISIGMIMSSTLSVMPQSASAATSDENHAKGAVIEDGSYLTNALYKRNNNLMSSASLPSYVDLSNTAFFPEIGNQGNIGSCTAFATTYYQYSYEVNKLNNISSVSDRTTYSPAFTYGLLSNGNIASGISISDAYEMLANFGCLKSTDLPYSTTQFVDYPANKEDEKLEALATRLTSFGTYDIMAEGTVITSNTDSDLNQVKTALNNGKVLVITTPYSWDIKSGYGNYSDKMIHYRATWSNAGHAMAVVGYNDDVTCDVNGNGMIEPSEKGAFKVANSWGKNYGNDDNGYIWVSYDALNKVSANTVNNWESKLKGTRHSAFEFACEENAFFYINVDHKTLNYVGEVKINSYDRTKIQLGINRTTKSTTSSTTYNSIFPFNSNLTNTSSFNGVVLFDYSGLNSPIRNYLNGYNWHTKIIDYSNTSSNSRFRILDNFKHVLSDYEANNTQQANSIYKYKTLSYVNGDANLGGSLDLYDVILVSQYINKTVDLSNVQFALADYNNDGVVNLYDAIAISQALNK